MTSTIDPSLPPLKPHYPPPQNAPDLSSPPQEPPHLASLIKTLNLQQHIEGGYFVETDRDPWRIPNPFYRADATTAPNTTTFYTSTGAVSADLSAQLTDQDKAQKPEEGKEKEGEEDKAKTRNASTTIHYLLTPQSPQGAWHRNRGRTIHTLHKGRGRYVIIHADEIMPSYDSHYGVAGDRKAKIETFVVGHDTERGERLQWIVEGGKYKASFLLPVGDEKEGEEEGLLISETVVPGFEYEDHDFMRVERLEALLRKEQADEVRWLLRRDDKAV